MLAAKFVAFFCARGWANCIIALSLWPMQQAKQQQNKSHKHEITTLLGTDISTPNVLLKMMFLFQSWDMLVSWSVIPKYSARSYDYPYHP